MNIDKNARYRTSHEYARKEGAEMVAGISDHAQESLGDIVFVELPAVGKVLKQGEAFGVVESVKAASDLYMPMSGKITAVKRRPRGRPRPCQQGLLWQGLDDPLRPHEPLRVGWPP